MKRRYVNNISRDLQIHSGKCRYIYYFIIFYLYSDYSVCRKIRDTNIQNINNCVKSQRNDIKRHSDVYFSLLDVIILSFKSF